MLLLRNCPAAQASHAPLIPVPASPASHGWLDTQQIDLEEVKRNKKLISIKQMLQH